ncbi:MAG: hypothetical protein COB38_04750 [Gammaproteobacteria bacterium]|nr:MAG: hypothetical protein COB38_04750 [Gammaproteobacteria bacterium]
MDKLFLGIHSHVVCISKKTGDKLWDTKIKSATITNVYFENDFVYAYSGGHLFCLKASNGEVVWENSLKGFGYGTCIIASESENTALIASQIATQQSVAASIAVTASVASSS